MIHYLLPQVGGAIERLLLAAGSTGRVLNYWATAADPLRTLKPPASPLSLAGGRRTDEDQQVRFPGDVGLEFVTDMGG